MHQALVLVPLLVLGWTWTLQGLPVLRDPLYPTQENFNFSQFVGTWYDLYFADSACPHTEQKKNSGVIGKQVLQEGSDEGKFKILKTVYRNGFCTEMSDEYDKTATPGRFFRYFEEKKAEVDAYVVHTNYDEYAIVIIRRNMTSCQNSTSIKLYSRTRTVRDTIVDDFKTLVKEQGMGEDTVITNQDKGDCVPGEPEAESVAEPKAQPQRARRDVVLPSLAPLDVEGSGDDTPLFNGTEACKSAPDTGPCFGLLHRYYYNSSSMSCEIFKYGGCLGNQNNFETERECLQRCRTEAVCRLPMMAQPCTGQPPIWAFDSSAGLCVPYKQGYCQANANKFYSKAECEEYCGVVKDEEELLKAN